MSVSDTSKDAGVLSVDGANVTFPRVPATMGNDGLMISSLLKDTGLVTLDAGFMNTAICESSITYIDGDNGILKYRGYPIDQLAANSTYLETAYLLIYGELPTKEQHEDWIERINRHKLLHEDLKSFFTTFPRDASPMAVLSSSVNAMAGFYPDELNPHDPDGVELSTVRLMAKLPTMVAYAYKKLKGEPQMYPDASAPLIEDFLRMTFGYPVPDYQQNPILVKAMHLLLILHGDHEQNCSTSIVRMVGSSGASMYGSISAGINALAGPLHGGANEEVLHMLQEIKDSGEEVTSFMERVKSQEDGIRLMGFGHRVYKNYDPRAAIAKKTADEVLGDLGVHDDLLDIALKLEEIALKDDYFVQRRLYPNVDFYTGIIYKAMGFPNSMFTPLFALGRLPGWIAQWREMNNDPQTKISRPRQVYVGAGERDYAGPDARGGGVRRDPPWWRNVG